jgi:organic radical activating enzyme
MANTFCPIPWIFQAARANGDLRVCCQANVTKNKGVIRKTDGTAYNAGTDDLQEARNGELMKNIRVNMLNGKWNEECGRCKREEENGLNSRRSYESAQWKFSLKDALQQTSTDGTIDTDKTPVVYYDLRFGNFCNLKCRMCGPADSDAWYKDWIELTGSNVFNDTSGDVTIEKVNGKLCASQFDWPNNEKFWEQLEKNAHNIEHVYFAGGEPLLIERHYDFLERCIEQDVAKNMLVEYNTNMSTLPPRVAKLWTHFKHVRVGASIDGYGKVLEYQRHPAKWDKIYKNLKTLDDMPDNIQSWFAFTVTAYNVFHMPDFMRWKLESSGLKNLNRTRRRPIVSHHVAHNPEHLNIRVLPPELKQLATQKFNDFVTWVEENNYPPHVVRAAKEISNGVCSYMNSGNYHNEWWSEFVNYTKSLDRIRNESIIDVEPIFKDYFK